MPAQIKFLFLLCLFSSVMLTGQITPPVFDRISGASFGIPEMDIWDILQDREGFIWIATRKGLIRYDGHEMVVFQENPLDTNSLSDNRVTVLAEDGAGHLWIGTDYDGLLRFDKQTEKFTHYLHDPADPASLSNNLIKDLLVDSENRLWIGTVGGLNLFDREKQAFIRFQDLQTAGSDPGSTYVECLAEDQQGMIWVGSWKDGLFRVNPRDNSVRQFSFEENPGYGIKSNSIIRIDTAIDGQVWFSTRDAGINRIDPLTFQISSFSPGLMDNRDVNASNIRDFVFDKAGGMWLGTFGRGVYYFKPQTGQILRFRHDPALATSITSDMVRAFCLDQNDFLWIGHRGPGLSRISTRSNGFEILSIQNPEEKDLSFIAGQVVMEDRSGNCWIGTWEAGLLKYEPKTGKTRSFLHRENDPQSLSNNIVWDLLEDRNGYIWIATHDGLQRLDPVNGNRMTTFGEGSGLKRTAIRSLLEMKDGRLAIGTFGGLHWLYPGSDRIEIDTTLPNNMEFAISSLFEDSRGNLWAAALEHGLFRFDRQRGTWSHFFKKRNDLNGLTNNTIWSIVEDDQGRIWIGTDGGGLNLFIPHPTSPDSSSFQHWRVYNSALPDDNIKNVLIDDRQKLWLSTEAGLQSFDTENFKLNSYSLSGSISALNIFSRNKPGKQLYLGNAQFIYRFYPDSIRQNDQPPPVFITDIQVDGRLDTFSLPQSPLYTDRLNLNYRQNNLTFTFTALNYIYPGKNQYRYFLEGYDQDTTQVRATRRFARYTNLAPGEYIFRVMASNNEGVWNDIGKSIAIVIYPPWWRTQVAYVLWILLLLGGIYTLYRFQLQRKLEKAERLRLAELNELRTRLYTNITHEFRTPITVILGIARQLESRISETVRENLQLIKRNGQHLLQLVNQVLDLSKLEYGHLKLEYEQGDVIGYLKYLLKSFHSLASSREIDLHFSSDHQEFMMDFDPVRLMHVISNLLSNAIKFTRQKGKVQLEVEVPDASEHKLLIKVKDNGIGISPDKLPFIFDRFYQVADPANGREAGSGIGLTLTKELVTLMGGSISAQSEPGKGSTFFLELPVSRNAPVKIKEGYPSIWEEKVVAATPEKSASNGKVEKPLVLIVEDHADLVSYLSGTLTANYQVEIASNGKQGIEKAQQLIPDIIITDVMMPEKNGYELCRSLKTFTMTSHIPIIMLTAKVDVDSRLTGFRQGADAYLEKPFLEEELQVRMEGLLAQRRKLQTYYRSKLTENEMSDAPIDSGENNKTQDEFLIRINQLINNNLENEQFSVEQLARELFVDPSNLYRKIKALTDLSPTQYIRSIRIAEARRLLKTTRLPVQMIAAKCGFAYTGYFSRMFKKATGMTPSRFREANRE